GAARAGARALRRGRRGCLSRVLQGEQHRLLRSPRLPCHRAGTPASRAVHVEDVARAAPVVGDVHATRLAAQLLAGDPAPTPLAVAERLLAVQAQDARGVRLAIRARTRGLRAADLDRALTVDRSLVITWLNRGTLHLV